MRNLIFNANDHTYTYVPTGEIVNAECLDEFANRKLEEAIGRLALASARLMNGALPTCQSCARIGGPTK